jgi:hypothetical protein
VPVILKVEMLKVLLKVLLAEGYVGLPPYR